MRNTSLAALRNASGTLGVVLITGSLLGHAGLDAPLPEPLEPVKTSATAEATVASGLTDVALQRTSPLERTPDDAASPGSDRAEPFASSSARPAGLTSGAGATAQETVPAPVAPVEVDFDRLGGAVPVESTTVDGQGRMELPADAALAGWYSYGPAPSNGTGTTVIAAHAGSAETPVGPFNALRGARAGDRLEVRDAAGALHRYEVTAVEQLDKELLDLQPYFRRDGDPLLVLVTCGGQWLADRSTYADNIIVSAQPIA